MASSSDTELIKKVNKGKKRKINYANWKDVTRKRLRNSGQSYSTRKGKDCPMKNAPTEECNCRCEFHCKNFSIEEMKSLFEMFYKLSYDEQCRFLSNLVEIKEPVRRRVPENVSRRHVTATYFLQHNNGRRVRVCRKMICHTFQITARRIQILLIKLKSGQELTDLRGKHKNRPHKIVDEEKRSVKEHIASFPSQESHYGRISSKKNCLNPDLTITQMFHLYKEKYPETSLSYNTYRGIFNSDFDLRFGVPRSDTCKVCDKFFIQMVSAPDTETLSSVEKLAELHHRKAEKAYRVLNEDGAFAKNNDSFVVFCVDLQQVIFTPNLTHSDVYYQRQYSNYNFAIHNLGTNEAYMYTWHETIAKRGAAEIASCIFSHIVNHYSVLQTGEMRKLIVWSDRCVGQNNNWIMIALFQYLIKLNYFNEINQKFMVSGHSFLPCDRDFALIEKKRKTARLYVPDDVINLIESARPSNPFLVHTMCQDEIKDFYDLAGNLRKDNKCKVTEARWIQLTSDEPETLRLRKTHDIHEAWSFFSLVQNRKGRHTQKNAAGTNKPYELQPLRKDLIPISSSKKKDLVAISEFLPEEIAQFYKNLPSE